jgi:PAS domain S-box-containing protein
VTRQTIQEFEAALNMGNRKKTSDDDSQREFGSLKGTKRKTSKMLQATNDLLWSRGLFSPGRILVIMIGGIALAEVIAMIVVYFVRSWSYSQQVILDTIIMVTIICPLLYFLSFKPLILQIQQRSKAESIILARLRMMQFANTHTFDELLQFSLDEIETLAGSEVNFFHFLEDDQQTPKRQGRSTNTLKGNLVAEGQDAPYKVGQASIWTEAVRLHQPVIHNQITAQPDQEGFPEEHALIVREMAIPILRNNKVVAVLGLGNKSQDFTLNDVNLVSALADFTWDIFEYKQAEVALRRSEEKFRTFADWTYDWETWLDPHGNFVYTSPSCERITGYSPEEFIADPDLLIQIVHPGDRRSFEEHQTMVHVASAGPARIEYRIITRDGEEGWIEHVCRPLFSEDDRYLGRRTSTRDITYRKQTEKKIAEQHRKEAILTQTIQTIQTDIARDLHDTLGQNISFLRMNLAHLSEMGLGSQASTQIKIQNMTKAANESYELIRATLAVLQSGYPDDPLGLFARYAEQVAERSSFQVDITGQESPTQLSPYQIRQLFYIFREALSNIEKYARASRVSGEFIWDDRTLTLAISDNGIGFHPDSVNITGHYGLKFMRERAERLKGTLSVQSVPGRGSTITVVIPYEYEPSSDSQ